MTCWSTNQRAVAPNSDHLPSPSHLLRSGLNLKSENFPELHRSSIVWRRFFLFFFLYVCACVCTHVLEQTLASGEFRSRDMSVTHRFESVTFRLQFRRSAFRWEESSYLHELHGVPFRWCDLCESRHIYAILRHPQHHTHTHTLACARSHSETHTGGQVESCTYRDAPRDVNTPAHTSHTLRTYTFRRISL